MNNVLATKPASVLRAYTQQVRNHAGAMQRLQDQYLAALRRAETQYFDGVNKIRDAMLSDAGGEPASEQQQTAEPQQQAVAS